MDWAPMVPTTRRASMGTGSNQTGTRHLFAGVLGPSSSGSSPLAHCCLSPRLPHSSSQFGSTDLDSRLAAPSASQPSQMAVTALHSSSKSVSCSVPPVPDVATVFSAYDHPSNRRCSSFCSSGPEAPIFPPRSTVDLAQSTITPRLLFLPLLL